MESSLTTSEVNIILNPKPEKDKEKYKLLFLVKIGAEILNKKY